MTTAEQAARQLGAASRSSNGWWQCRCPAHEDRKASLLLHDTEDGGISWRCMAGCSKADVGRALKAAGLLPERRNVVAMPARRGASRIVATYGYTDAKGKLLYEVVRFEPKDFRQRRPDPGSPNGWQWSLGDMRRVLYRLPEVLAEQRTVFVVEGEKDADRLAALGCTATTCAQGAGKWRREYSEALAGKHVVILPDNDAAGRQHAMQVAAMCAAGGSRSVRVLDLPVREKGDVSDWLDAGGTLDELLELAAATPTFDEAGSRDLHWKKRLQLNQGDPPQPVGHELNAIIALEHAPELAGVARLNSFTGLIETRGFPASRRQVEWRPWGDTDTFSVLIWMQEQGLRSMDHGTLHRALEVYVSRETKTHPVREYLAGLAWDGIPRLGALAALYFGVVAEDEAEARYFEASGRAWMISAVARIMTPGCKVDTVLVLEGRQGTGKSTALRILGGPWFSDQLSGPIGSRDAKAGLRGRWIVELQELAAVRKSDVETIKAFVSEQTDSYRPAYARLDVHVARQCVFAASTNRSDYLKDETGNRRWLPWRCGEIDLEGLRRDRDQLWAEAMAAHAAGEAWTLPEIVREQAEAQQAARVEIDAWQAVVEEYVADKDRVGLMEVFTAGFGFLARDVSRADELRVASILRNLQFARKVIKSEGKPVRRWVRQE